MIDRREFVKISFPAPAGFGLIGTLNPAFAAHRLSGNLANDLVHVEAASSGRLGVAVLDTSRAQT
jgi:hypothetical protein